MMIKNGDIAARRVGGLLAMIALGLVGSTAQAGISLVGGAPLPAATRPGGVAAGDLNADGIADLVVTVDAPDRVLVYLGTGGGSFSLSNTILLGVGVGARDIAIARVNADASPDLVVVEHNMNRIVTLTNNGNATFANGPTASVGADARGLSVGDLNGDGTMDFAVANRDSNTVSVILNVGGVLGSTSIPAGDEPRATAIGDVTGDANPDLVASSHRTRTVLVYAGNGTGAFSSPAAISVGAQVRPSGLAIADMNADGKGDLAVANSGDNAGLHFVSLYMGSAGGLGAGVNYPTLGLDPGAIALADFDHDGDADVAVANESSANISLLQNLGGVLGPAALMGAGAHPTAMVALDLDGNSSIDLAVPNRDSDNVSLFFNTIVVPPACPADVDDGTGTGTPDAAVTIDDLLYFLDQFAMGQVGADLDNGSGTGTPDGGVTVDDLVFFLDHYALGC